MKNLKLMQYLEELYNQPGITRLCGIERFAIVSILCQTFNIDVSFVDFKPDMRDYDLPCVLHKDDFYKLYDLKYKLHNIDDIDVSNNFEINDEKFAELKGFFKALDFIDPELCKDVKKYHEESIDQYLSIVYANLDINY